MVVVAPEEDSQLLKLLKHVVDVMDPLEVWLFGSRAEGRARPTSDYDVLVVLPDSRVEEWLDPVKAWQVGRDVRVIADIVPCGVSDFEEERHELDTLASAAAERGKKLFER